MKNTAELCSADIYYEARIKIQRLPTYRGAVWLMSPVMDILWNGVAGNEGVIGTEIDIIENFSWEVNEYNSALNWNGYNPRFRSALHRMSTESDVDIFDGEFHTFVLDWSPSEYMFYVDDQVFWRVDGGSDFNNCGINQNPNYIKLTVERADCSQALSADFIENEMLIDYIRVYNQPRK